MSFVGANVLLVAHIAWSLYLSDPRNVVPEGWSTAAWGATGAGFGMILSAYARVIKSYNPSDALAAKRTNEQLKLMATFWNGIAIRIVAIFGFNVAASSGDQFTNQKFILAVGAAFYVHSQARSLLANLKNETAKSKAGALNSASAEAKEPVVSL